MTQTILSSLLRYPVKSMAGEALGAADVAVRGVVGDRAYALVNMETGVVASAKTVKRFGPLLGWQAQYVAEPTAAGAVPAVRLTTPEGKTILSDAADAEALLLAAFGPGVALCAAPPEGVLLEFPAGTVSGDLADLTQAPLGGAALGTFSDLAAIHLVTTSTLRALAAASPETAGLAARLRANLILEPGDAEGFVENSWLGRTLHIGADLVLRLTMPTMRCVMTTLAHGTNAAAPTFLRTLARHNLVDFAAVAAAAPSPEALGTSAGLLQANIGKLPCAGLYADVLHPGRVAVGDVVRLGD
jgi:hypothetical protein